MFLFMNLTCTAYIFNSYQRLWMLKQLRIWGVAYCNMKSKWFSALYNKLIYVYIYIWSIYLFFRILALKIFKRKWQTINNVQSSKQNINRKKNYWMRKDHPFISTRTEVFFRGVSKWYWYYTDVIIKEKQYNYATLWLILIEILILQ